MVKGLSFEKTIKRILIEQSDEYYKISPKEFEELMKFGGYNGNGVTKLKMFGGKPLWITGDLDLSDTPTTSLGNVKYIEGKLNIGNTSVSDISGIDVKGYVWDHNTPIQAKRKAKERREKLESGEERRTNREWDLDNPDITELGEKANALYKHLVVLEDIFEPTEEMVAELDSIQDQIDELSLEYDETDNPELFERIQELKNREDELRNEVVTVYNIIPMRYSYYGLEQFEVIGGEAEGQEFTVGDEDDMDSAALEYAKNYVDEVGLDGFNRNFVKNYLDESAIEDFFRDHYLDDVRENPEIYFNPDEMPTTEEQDRRKEELEQYIETVQGAIVKFEQKQESLNDTIEDPDEYKKQWELIEEKIKILQGHLDDSQQEIDEMVPEGQPTTQMIEDEAERQVSDRMYDPASSLTEWGMDISEYVDMDALAKGLVESDGYGIMGSYDGSYDTELINGTTYYIMRIS